MLLGSTPRKNYELLIELADRENFMPISDILRDTQLDWFQNVTLTWSILAEKCMVILDTGLGKTLIAIAYIKFLTLLTKKKFIFICENNNYKQTESNFKKYSNLSTFSVTGESDRIDSLLLKNLSGIDVVLTTYEGIRNINLNNYLVGHKDKFIGIVVDECQKLGNLESITSRIVRSICRQMQYALFLSATPMTTAPDQFVNIMSVMDSRLIPNPKKYISAYKDVNYVTGEISYHDLDSLSKDLALKFIGFTREELGLEGNHKINVKIIEPPLGCERVTRKDMFRLLKGASDCDGVKKLIKDSWEYKSRGMVGLIYCNLNANKLMLSNVLKENGINAMIYDGHYTKDKDKTAIKAKYQAGEYDVLITNLATGGDFPSDYISFWELTVNYTQMKGRGVRGLVKKDLDLNFYITSKSCEVSYFYEKVYKQSWYLQALFKKNISDLEKVLELLRQ